MTVCVGAGDFRPIARASRQPVLDPALVVCATMWVAFALTGLRAPWSPIVVSDADAGAALRQVLFTLSAGIAVWRLLVTRLLASSIVDHLGIVLLASWLFATCVFSVDPVLTVKRSIVHAFGVVVLIALVKSSPRPVALMQRVIVGVAAAGAVVSLFAMFAFPANCTTITERPGLAGVSPHPNTLGPAMAIGFVLSLGMTPSTRARRTIVIGARVAMVLALILTDSVTSMLMCAVSIVVYVMLAARSYNRGAIQLGASILLCLVLLVGIGTLKSGFFQMVGRDESLSGRDVLWPTVLEEGMRSPLYGAGYGAFWYEGRGRDLMKTWNPRSAHHAYIDVFVDLGIVGIVGVGVIVGGGLWAGWFTQRGRPGTKQRRATASMIAVAAGLFGVSAFSESFIFKLDKLPMLAVLWSHLLLRNSADNRIAVELASET